MNSEALNKLLWDLAVLFGWLSLLPTALAWHARKRFKVLLKAPLSAETERMTRLCEVHSDSWSLLGRAMSSVSVASLFLWAVVALAH